MLNLVVTVKEREQSGNAADVKVPLVPAMKRCFSNAAFARGLTNCCTPKIDFLRNFMNFTFENVREKCIKM